MRVRRLPILFGALAAATLVPGLAAAVPVLQITPDPLDFGPVPVNAVAQDSLVFRNTGDANVVLGSMAIVLGPEFSVGGPGGVGGPGTVIAPGDSLFVPLAFRPTAQNPSAATLRVASNDPVNPEQSISLLGLGAGGPAIQVSPTSFSEGIDFGDTLSRALAIRNVGETSLDWILSIRPVTSRRAELDGVKILWDRTKGQSSPLSWSILVSEAEARGAVVEEHLSGAITASVLAPYRIYVSTDLSSGWAAEERAALKAWVEAGGGLFLIGDNTATVSHFNGLLSHLGAGINMTFAGARDGVVTSSKITGHESTTGIERVFIDIGVKQITPVTSPGFSLVRDIDDSTVVALSELDVGRVAVVADELFNDVTIGEAEAAGTPADNRQFGAQILDWLAGGLWLRADLAAGTVAPADSANLNLVFDASELSGGTFEASIQIESNDAAAPVVDVPVSLTVTGSPEIEVLPVSLSFGTIPQQTSLPDTLVVRNAGTEPLNVTSITSNDPAFSPQGGTFSLAPGDSQAVEVVFLPDAVGVFAGQITITSNAFEDPTLAVPVDGRGGVNCALPCTAPSLRPIDAEGSHGFEFWMDVRVDSAPTTIQSYGFEMRYDGDHLEYAGEARAGDLAPGFVVFGTENEPGRLTCGGFGAVPVPSGATGSLLQLRFRVECDTCTAGVTSDLWVSDLADDVAGLAPCCGALTIADCPTGHGDVNADTTLSATDALCALKIFTNGGTTPPDSACDVNGDCEPAAADVNCDDVVTPSDALAIYERVLCVEDPVPVACFAQGAPSPCGTPRRGGATWSWEPGEASPEGGRWVTVRTDGRALGLELEAIGGAEIARVEPGPGWRASFDADTGRLGTYATAGASGSGGVAARLRVRGDGGILASRSWDAAPAGSSELLWSAPPVREGLLAVQPNPSPGSLRIRWAASPGRARQVLRIHDVSGRVVRDLAVRGAGEVETLWDGRDAAGRPVAAGVYFVSLRLDDERWTRKVLLVR